MSDLYFPFLYEVKLIISLHRDLVSSLSVSICPSSPLPNLQLPVLQMPSTTSLLHPPSFHCQFHGMNASDCHFWTLLIRKAKCWEWPTKRKPSFTVVGVFFPRDVGSCNCNVRCDVENGSIDGREEASPQVDD